jgi:hypothetical protein
LKFSIVKTLFLLPSGAWQANPVALFIAVRTTVIHPILACGRDRQDWDGIHDDGLEPGGFRQIPAFPLYPHNLQFRRYFIKCIFDARNTRHQP